MYECCWNEEDEWEPDEEYFDNLWVEEMIRRDDEKRCEEYIRNGGDKITDVVPDLTAAPSPVLDDGPVSSGAKDAPDGPPTPPDGEKK